MESVKDLSRLFMDATSNMEKLEWAEHLMKRIHDSKIITAMLFYNALEDKIHFYLFESDYSHLNGLVIGCSTNDQELLELLYDDHGEPLQKDKSIEEFCVAVTLGATPIICREAA